jgi:hypothetical protein
MIRVALVLAALCASPAFAGVFCVDGSNREDFELLRAARPTSAPALIAGDTRTVVSFNAARCAVSDGTRVELLAKRENLATLRVIDGPSADCIGELAVTAVGMCEEKAPPVEVVQPRREAPATVRVEMTNGPFDGIAIPKWRTVDGRVYFGDKPPAGSVKIGEVEGLVTSYAAQIDARRSN